MTKFDLNSSKYLILLSIICAIFAGVVFHAFRYLPSEQKTTPDVNQISNNDEITLPKEENNNREESAESNTEIKDSEIDPPVAAERRRVEIPEEVRADLPNIDFDRRSNTNESRTFDEAQQSFNSENYDDALAKYKEALNDVQTAEEKAICYEKIASIYGIKQQFGTALAYAQKAYSAKPSTNREVLLARFMYKTGKTNKASEHMDNVLRRSFKIEK